MFGRFGWTVLTLTAVLLGPLPSPGMAEELLAIVGNLDDREITTSLFVRGYGADGQWAPPSILPAQMPSFVGAGFAELGGLQQGGFGCNTYLSDGRSVVECKGGRCGGTPVLSTANADVFVDQLYAGERFVYAVQGAGPGRVALSRFDSITRTRLNRLINVTQLGNSVADIHGIYGYQDRVDVLVRWVPQANVNRTLILRLDLRGELKRVFVLPIPRFAIDAAVSPNGQRVYFIESTGTAQQGYGVARYDLADYSGRRQILPMGTVDPLQLFEATDRSIVAIKTGDGRLFEWDRDSGAELGVLPLPDGIGFFARIAASSCDEDNTRIRLGTDGRFEVFGTVYQNGVPGPIRFLPPLSNDSAVAYFSSPSNAEMLLKILDVNSFASGFWVFGSAATTLRFVLTFVDTETNRRSTYNNGANTPARSFADTGSFTP